MARTTACALGPLAFRIDHVGSTAVPGLTAKPSIAIQISIAELAPHDSYHHGLESIGQIFRADNPDLMKRYFREVPGTRRTHLYVRRAARWSEQLALLFRDDLRIDSQTADEYAALKRQLGMQYRHDRQRYTDAREPFIWEVMRRAD